jgi:catechol 2,3-dioxygenase-like lactoylglutathione lyase family enzyme
MTVSQIEHILVLSEDIDWTRDFYCRVLGLQVGDRPPLQFPGYWLYAAGVPCIHIAERAAYSAHAEQMGLRASPKVPGTGAVDHVAFTASDYEELSARLERNAVPVVRNSIPAAGLRQLFFRDPNGVRIEVNVPGDT